MILKQSVDYLMKEVRWDEFVNICMGEIICEWLQEMTSEMVIDDIEGMVMSWMY